MPAQSSDPSSCARLNDHITKHIKLQWDVDFESKTVSGTATLSVESRSEAPQLVFYSNYGDYFC